MAYTPTTADRARAAVRDLEDRERRLAGFAREYCAAKEWLDERPEETPKVLADLYDRATRALREEEA